MLQVLPAGPWPPFPSPSAPGSRKGLQGCCESKKTWGFWGETAGKCTQVSGRPHLCSHSLVQVFRNSNADSNNPCSSGNTKGSYYGNTQFISAMTFIVQSWAGRFRLDIRNHPFTKRVVRHWNRLMERWLVLYFSQGIRGIGTISLCFNLGHAFTLGQFWRGQAVGLDNCCRSLLADIFWFCCADSVHWCGYIPTFSSWFLAMVAFFFLYPASSTDWWGRAWLDKTEL